MADVDEHSSRDALWFERHPGREYMVRAAGAGEAGPGPGLVLVRCVEGRISRIRALCAAEPDPALQERTFELVNKSQFGEETLRALWLLLEQHGTATWADALEFSRPVGCPQ